MNQRRTVPAILSLTAAGSLACGADRGTETPASPGVDVEVTDTIATPTSSPSSSSSGLPPSSGPTSTNLPPSTSTGGATAPSTGSSGETYDPPEGTSRTSPDPAPSVNPGTTEADTPSAPGDTGACETGTTETAWAESCPTEVTQCVAGEWRAGGPDPDHSQFALRGESEHFAIYSDENLQANIVQNALDVLENNVWKFFFGAPIHMKEPLCNSATKYKASIHVHSDWGLTGGSWAPNRMGMWLGTGGLSDTWGLAHEFTHAVQSVAGGQSCNRSNTCGWVYESHANFMAHQLTEYRNDVHCSEMLVNAPHLYLGSTRDRYCNWQFMEFLKDRHCYRAVNEIWTGAPTPDPFSGIMQAMNWSVSELNDFIGEWAMHNITWDYKDPPPTTRTHQGPAYRRGYGAITDRSQVYRRLRTTRVLPLNEESLDARRFFSPSYWAPQRFGYNVVRLFPEAGATSVRVKFAGVPQAAAKPGFRWGLVATDGALEEARYSALQTASGELDFCLGDAEELFLVVTATPEELETIVWDQPYNTVRRYPYLFEVHGAWPEGFRDGKRDECPSGLSRATNGGGCAPAGTTAYVGPYATVLANATVSGAARIEDHAVVARGTVSGGTVGAMTLIGNGNSPFTMTSGEAKTTFYPLGFFEGNQGLSGGTLIGDVEYRGAGVSRTSGTCSGFVDGSTCVSPGEDATLASPSTWIEP